MHLSPTLSVYIARQFLLWVGTLLAGLVALIVIIDFLEFLRRGATRENATLSLIVEMVLLRAPTMAQLVVPFAILFGAMFTFWRLSRNHELVIVRAAGVSVWQFLVPALAFTLAIGILQLTLFGPFAALLLGRFERIETLYFSNRPSTSGLFPSGLWLRQADSPGQAVIHAQRVAPNSSTLERVVIFRFAPGDRFISRIDASSAVLRQGYWELNDGQMTTAADPTAPQRVATLPTELTWPQIEESFSHPETLSFWELPGFIDMLESAGFSALRHRLHYQSLLASPLLLCAMVLIAATFSLRPGRRRTGRLVAAGIGTGFVFYILSDLISAMGLSGRLPVDLAAWAPAAICLLLGGTMLLHQEDG